MFKNYLLRMLIFCGCSAILASPSANAAEDFGFKQNDVVAIYGNGLADRMQHAPWVEAVLQSQLKGAERQLPEHELLRRHG